MLITYFMKWNFSYVYLMYTQGSETSYEGDML